MVVQWSESAPYPLSSDFDLSMIEDELRAIQNSDPTSLKNMVLLAEKLGLSPADFALFLEAVELRDRDGNLVTPAMVWDEVTAKLTKVMTRSVNLSQQGNKLTTLSGDWSKRLAAYPSMLSVGWHAFTYAIGVQEFNAGMGLVAAAPTGGAAGTVPGTILAVASSSGHGSLARAVQALFVAGLVGRVAFGRGPVSGAQAGCGGEIGVAAAMAAAAVTTLLGGGWKEADAAASLAATPWIGIECSPSYGLVEYPCIPRNGYAAIGAIASAEAACAGIKPPYNTDETFDRIFAWGQMLPEDARERESGHWMAGALRLLKHSQGGDSPCGKKGCGGCHG